MANQEQIQTIVRNYLNENYKSNYLKGVGLVYKVARSSDVRHASREILVDLLIKKVPGIHDADLLDEQISNHVKNWCESAEVTNLLTTDSLGKNAFGKPGTRTGGGGRRANISTEQVAELVAKALAQQLPNVMNKPVEIHLNGKKIKKLEKRLHYKFTEVLELAHMSSQKNIWLVGNAGTGKTTLGENVSEGMNLEFGCISCTEGMSRGDLLGFPTAEGGYIPSPLVRICESGGVFLFDEVDAADANTMLVINSLLANGILSIPFHPNPKKQMIKRHPETIIICAANTWGTGSVEFVGRNQLDEAFRDRFAVTKVEVDYDTSLEKAIMSNQGVLSKLWSIRKVIQDTKMKRTLSTRMIRGVQEQLDGGQKYDEIMKRYTLGWKPEEVERIKAYIS